MGKFNLWWILRDIIGGIGWKVFIGCSGMSKEAYWHYIYLQEVARKSEESPATPSNSVRNAIAALTAQLGLPIKQRDWGVVFDVRNELRQQHP